MSELVSAIIGGTLIGVAVVTLNVWLGRVAGISGIAWQAVRQGMVSKDNHWRWLFLVGLVLGPTIVGVLEVLEGAVSYVPVSAPLGVLIVSGLLVGFGSQLGSGCTSGHAVCGVSKRSVRSLVATGCFMVSGIVTATSLAMLGGW